MGQQKCGSVLSVVEVALEITERKRAAEALRQTSHLLDTLSRAQSEQRQSIMQIRAD